MTPELFDQIFASIRFLTLHRETFIAKLAVEDSFEPFCQGFPGSMHAVLIFDWLSQRKTARETNSEPLSDLKYAGAPCTLTNC